MKKNRSVSRVLALALAIVLAAGLLSGCGKKNNKDSEGLSEFVYVPQYTELPEEISDISQAYLSGDTVYFTSYVPVNAEGVPLTKEEVEAWEKGMEAYYNSVESFTVPAEAVDEAADEALVEAQTAVAAASGTDLEPEAAEEEEPAETQEAAAADTDIAVGPMPVYPEEYANITYTSFLFAINRDGSGYRQLEKFKPMETGGDPNTYVSMDRLAADGQGGLWISETKSTTIYDLPDDFDPMIDNQWDYYEDEEVQAFIRRLSPEGEELASLDLSQYYEQPQGTDDYYGGRFYVNDMTADKAGNLYVSDGQTIYVLDGNANFLFKLSSEEWFSNFISTKNGEIGITQGAMKPDGTYGNMLKIIDLSTKDWGKEYEISNNVWNTSSGGDQYDFCYNDSSSLFGYDLETGTAEKVLTWLNSDVNGDTVFFSTIQDDGNVFAIYRDYDYTANKEDFGIIVMVKTPRSEVPQKHILTLATMWTDYNLKKQILKFNKTNPDYRIELSDYSEYITDSDYYAGITKLNTEIISGKIPDLISLSSLPYQQYAAKGLLEDLYPYLDADTGLGRDALVSGALKAMETDGKLYQLATGFSAISIVGKASVVGTGMGWTMSELRQIVDDHPDADYPFGMYVNRASLMQMFTMLNIDSYIDWQNGTCSFDSEDFKQLLSFVKTFPEDLDESAYEEGNWIDPAILIQDGRQLFELFDIGDFESYQYYKARFGGDITFKGMPTEDGSIGNVASLTAPIAMSSSCSDKDGAWQFLRTLLDEEFQINEVWNLPVNQKAFDKKLAEAMKQEYYTDENGNQVPISKGGISFGDGEMVELYALSQEEVDQILEVVNSITRVYSYDESTLNIINEEAEYFFKGEKTVDQTAEIIQSRMMIFINEQR